MVTGTWQEFPEMRHRRTEFVLEAYDHDGLVTAFGGYQGGHLNTVEEFDGELSWDYLGQTLQEPKSNCRCCALILHRWFFVFLSQSLKVLYLLSYCNNIYTHITFILHDLHCTFLLFLAKFHKVHRYVVSESIKYILHYRKK